MVLFKSVRRVCFGNVVVSIIQFFSGLRLCSVSYAFVLIVVVLSCTLVSSVTVALYIVFDLLTMAVLVVWVCVVLLVSTWTFILCTC